MTSEVSRKCGFFSFFPLKYFYPLPQLSISPTLSRQECQFLAEVSVNAECSPLGDLFQQILLEHA